MRVQLLRGSKESERSRYALVSGKGQATRQHRRCIVSNHAVSKLSRRYGKVPSNALKLRQRRKETVFTESVHCLSHLA